MQLLKKICFFGCILNGCILNAQKLTDRLVFLSSGAAIGAKVYQGSIGINDNCAFNRRHRSFFSYGARVSYSAVNKEMYFEVPRTTPPDFFYKNAGTHIATLNLVAGLRYAITNKLHLSASSEVLGFSFGNQHSGILTRNGNSSTFTGDSYRSNFLLKGGKSGNIQHQILLHYQLHNQFYLVAGYSYLRTMYEFQSGLNEFEGFDLIDQSSMGSIGIDWVLPTKK